MPIVSQRFFKVSVIFLILGILMGLQMSITENYNVTGAHAHTNLIGWVTSALFGGYYALNPGKAQRKATAAHFWIHTLSVSVMTPGLYFWSIGYDSFAPIVGIVAVIALVSALLFTYIVYSSDN